MSTLDLLTTRIKSAQRTRSKTSRDNLSLREIVALINPKLEKLVRLQKVPGRGTVEEVFPCEDRPDERPFLFGVLKTPDDISAFAAYLKQKADPKENWRYELWLQQASLDGKLIITTRREGDPNIAGYAVIGANLSVEDHTGVDAPEPTTYLSVDLNSIYITPEERGKGFSQALSWAAGWHVDTIYYAIAEWSDPDRKYLEKLPFEIFIRGEAHSPGGARFMSRTVEEIESNLEMSVIDTTWDISPILTDDCDFSDYPCGGFGPGR